MNGELWADDEIVGAMQVLGRTSGAETETAIARVAWSVLIEPGDGDAGRLIEEHGAVEALRLISEDGVRRSSPGLSGIDRGEARARWLPRWSRDAVLDAVRHAGDVGASLLLPGDDNWPTALDDLGPHAPVVLWVRGRAELLSAAPRYW